MEQLFASLTKRQTMLLLTSLAFGGSESVKSFEHLTPDEEELLKFRAQSLLQIPREKRVPLLVQEIKRLVTQRRRQLGAADPARLAKVLSKERPVLVEVVLRALPSELAEAVRRAMPNHPTVRLTHEVRPDVLSIVRWKLEDALKHNAPQVGTFRFTDVLTLQPRELLSVADRMGARVLATAIAGLSDADAEQFLAKLPPDQRALAHKAAEAGRGRRLNEDDAKTVLELHGAIDDPSAGMRSAGLQRPARACVAQSPEFAQRVVQRHGGELGEQLKRLVKDEAKRPLKGDGGRLDIVEQMERLAQKGVIDRPIRLPAPARGPGGPSRPPTSSTTRVSRAPKGTLQDDDDDVTAGPPTGSGVPRRKTSQTAGRSRVIKGANRGPSGGSK